MRRIIYWGLFFLFSINGYAQTFKLKLFSMIQPLDILSSDSIVLEYKNRRFYLNKRETKEFPKDKFDNAYVLYGNINESMYITTSSKDTLSIYFRGSAIKECRRRLNKRIFRKRSGEFVDITKKSRQSDPYYNSVLLHNSSSSHVSHISHSSHYSGN